MKNSFGNNLIEKAVSVLKGLLDETGFLSSSVEPRVGITDGILDIAAHSRSASTIYTFTAVVMSNGQPQCARRALDQLYRHRSENPGIYGIFIAPYISPVSAKMCSDQGVGYVDFEGNCLLRFDQVFIRTAAMREHKAEKRELRSLYSPRSERILRALLQYPSRSWPMQELASEANVSIGHVHNVKTQLWDRGWIESPGRSGGFILSKHDALLNDWPKGYNSHKTACADYFCLCELDELEARIAQMCESSRISYAFTGLSAAARRAPFVRYQRADLYIEGSDEQIFRHLELKRVPSGSNVRIHVPYDSGVLYGSDTIDGVRVVSAVQNYLDLVKEGGRAADGAEYLREHVIDPLWSHNGE
jgi:Transcriptional regulator, AbiEi antitoxin, Type IV TA system